MNNLLQKKALGMFLTEWNTDATYDWNIEMMRNEGDACGSMTFPKIVVWQPFENYRLADVADLIEDEYEALKQLIKDLG
jgi:hypothetical protein